VIVHEVTDPVDIDGGWAEQAQRRHRGCAPRIVGVMELFTKEAPQRFSLQPAKFSGGAKHRERARCWD
jgi:hypothetical protein